MVVNLGDEENKELDEEYQAKQAELERQAKNDMKEYKRQQRLKSTQNRKYKSHYHN